MFIKIGKYKVLEYKNCKIVISKENDKYTFYVQKANAIWHSMKSWKQVEDCEKYSREYVEKLNQI